MKLKTLVILSATAVISAALLPAATAQEGGTRFSRQVEAIDVRPDREGRSAHARHRHRPGGDPERLVDHLDTNEDGFVDVDEFLDARLGRVDDQFDRRDDDGDGLLSEDEARRRPPRDDVDETDRELVIACVRETIADWEGPHDVEDRFDAVDTNGDGFIDLVELSTSLEERAYVLFDRIDADGDGLLSLEEVEAHQEAQINLRRVIRACIDEVTDPFEATL